MHPKTIFHRGSTLLLAGVLTSLLVVFPVAAAASNITVDCTGATPGALTSLQAAIDSLGLVGPNQIDVVGGPCTENILIQDRQRLTITASPIGVFILSAVGPDDNVMRILGSTGITLIQLGFSNGANGLVIRRNSEVSVVGCTISGNAAAGLRVLENSTVLVDGAAILGNGGNGVVIQDSLLTIQGADVESNGGNGVVLRRARGLFQGFNGTNLFQGNTNGVNLVNGASAEFDAPNLIQNNQSIGMSVGDGSSVRLFGDVDANGNPIPNVISGNPFIGLNTFGGQVLLSGATQITNNGFGGQPFHAGVRVDDNTDFVSAGSGDIEISNNTGPGIAATAGGNIDMSGTVVKNNSGDGINLAGNTQVVFFPPNTNVLMGNGKLAINCDSTSVFLGDKTGVGKLACHVSQLNSASAAQATRRALRDSGRD
jgi:parallel beta helix pectate lyase-like protein